MQTAAQRLGKNRPLTIDEERRWELLATKRLWHKRYRIMIPRYAALTPEQLEMYGTCYNSGMTKDERTSYNKDLTLTWMSPIRQIALYSEGIPIAYPNRMKAIEIYKDIQLHVSNWKDLLGRSLNRRIVAPPMEDFDLMLEFAENLEAYLEYYYHHLQTNQSMEPFHKRTLNTFVNSDRYMHRGDSTYSRLRTGIYSFMGERRARTETPIQHLSPVQGNEQEHYQNLPEISEDEFGSVMASIRG